MFRTLTTIEEYDDIGLFRVAEAFTEGQRHDITLFALRRQQHREYEKGEIYYLVYTHERIEECNCYMSGK